MFAAADSTLDASTLAVSAMGLLAFLVPVVVLVCNSLGGWRAARAARQARRAEVAMAAGIRGEFLDRVGGREGPALLALRPGDLVDCRVRGKWTRCVVAAGPYVPYGWRTYWLRVRRPGRTPAGGRAYAVMQRPLEEVRPVTGADPVVANVFADFLEERGEAHAALLLREHFPLLPADSRK